jgi:hypothetical protein
MDTEEPLNSAQEGGNPGDTSRLSKLARKAESARQARLRHKQYVGQLQEQVRGLQGRCRTLEAQCGAEGTAAHLALQLKQVLKPEQHGQLVEWLKAAQGDDHVLQRYAAPSPLPPTPVGPTPSTPEISSSGSKPIAVSHRGRFRGEATTSDTEDDCKGRGLTRTPEPSRHQGAERVVGTPVLLRAAPARGACGPAGGSSAFRSRPRPRLTGATPPPPLAWPTQASGRRARGTITRRRARSST